MTGDVAAPAAGHTDTNGGVAAEISNRIVGLLKEYTGRGPTKARTFLDGNLVVCVFEEALTRGEQKMAEGGEAEHAVATRHAYQRLIREDARRAVEEATGRKVLAFLSDNVAEPDIGIEAFILEEEPGAG